AFDYPACLEGGSDHAPKPLMGRVVRVPYRRPVHHLVQAGCHQLGLEKRSLLVVPEMTTAPFISCGRHRRARQGEYLGRGTGKACSQPELEIARTIDVGELMAGLAGPGGPPRQRQ